MFESIKRAYHKIGLKDERFAYMFEKPSFDEFVAFDCETTGLSPKKDDIISIGAVKIRDGVIKTSEKFEVMVRPKAILGEESIKIHHIRNCDLDAAMEPKEALDAFLGFIGKRPLVGYYLEFDVAMINKYFRAFYGATLPNPQFETSAMYFDAKNDVFGSKNVDLGFESIIRDLDLPIFGQHSAYYDAVMTALIFIKLKKG